MAGAALRGFGAILKKAKVKGSYPATKPKVKGSYPATKPKGSGAGLRGQTAADLLQKSYPGVKARPKAVKAPPSIKKTAKETGKGLLIAGVAYAAGKSKAKKEAKAKAEKEKLEKAAEEHMKKTKERTMRGRKLNK